VPGQRVSFIPVTRPYVGEGADGPGSRGEDRVPGFAHPRGAMSEDWESIYHANVDRVYRLMFAQVGNRPDAEDLTAEVFKLALPPLRLSASAPEIRSYLFVTARTVLANHWRKRFGIEVTTLDPDLEVAQFDEAGMESQAPGRVAKILADLPDRYRRILELRFLESMSLREAAQAMGVSVGNAKVLQHRALRLAAHHPEGV
jgi:RNA polymerase sigma factor (sigma-70 family)